MCLGGGARLPQAHSPHTHRQSGSVASRRDLTILRPFIRRQYAYHRRQAAASAPSFSTFCLPYLTYLGLPCRTAEWREEMWQSHSHRPWNPPASSVPPSHSNSQPPSRSQPLPVWANTNCLKKISGSPLNFDTSSNVALKEPLKFELVSQTQTKSRS